MACESVITVHFTPRNRQGYWSEGKKESPGLFRRKDRGEERNFIRLWAELSSGREWNWRAMWMLGRNELMRRLWMVCFLGFFLLPVTGAGDGAERF